MSALTLLPGGLPISSNRPMCSLPKRYPIAQLCTSPKLGGLRYVPHAAFIMAYWPRTQNSSDVGNESNGPSTETEPNLQTFMNDFVCPANTNGTKYFFFEVWYSAWFRSVRANLSPVLRWEVEGSQVWWSWGSLGFVLSEVSPTLFPSVTVELNHLCSKTLKALTIPDCLI